MSMYDQRTAAILAKRDYEQNQVRGGGVSGLDAIGPPMWDRASWDLFHQKMGRYPSLREGDLPHMENAPDWAWTLQGLRPPPVDVGSGGPETSAPAQDLAVWKI